MEIYPEKTHSLKIKTSRFTVEAKGLPAVFVAGLGVLLIFVLLL